MLFWLGAVMLIVSASNIFLMKSYNDRIQECETEACAFSSVAVTHPLDETNETHLSSADMAWRILHCEHHESDTPIETYANIAIACITALVGVILIETSRRIGSTSVDVRSKVEHIVNSLEGEEKGVYRLVTEADGSIMQSDLVERSSLTKTKVSRILDRLEGKGLVERRRRGMGNLVVLKH